jgi:hypothetical protein
MPGNKGPELTVALRSNQAANASIVPESMMSNNNIRLGAIVFLLAMHLFFLCSTNAKAITHPETPPIIPIFVNQTEIMIIEQEEMGSNIARTIPAHHVCVRLLEIKEEPFSGLLCLANWLGAADDIWLLKNDKHTGTKLSVYYTGYRLSDVFPERALGLHHFFYESNNTLLNNLKINKLEHSVNNGILTISISLSFMRSLRVFKDQLIDGVININLNDILLDTDIDGLTDLAEKKIGTSSINKDSDQDGIVDTHDNNPLTALGNDKPRCALYEEAISAIITEMKIIDLPIPVAVIRLDGKTACSFELFQSIVLTTNLPFSAFFPKSGYDTFVFIGIDKIEIEKNSILSIRAFISATGKMRGLYDLLFAKDNGKWSLKKRHRFH